MRTYKNETVQELMELVMPCPTTGCWLWVGRISANGYGTITVRGRNTRAHRQMYELIKEKIPNGLHIDHLCRVKSCVNPNHLEAVTPKENVLRGNAPTAINARKTHCRHGHEFSPENTWVHSRKSERACKKCAAVDMKKWRSKVATYLLPCRGYNTLTGKRVGIRHRWNNSIKENNRLFGQCLWCHRTLEQLTFKRQEASLSEVGIIPAT